MCERSWLNGAGNKNREDSAQDMQTRKDEKRKLGRKSKFNVRLDLRLKCESIHLHSNFTFLQD